jgi:hypothetical protein
MKRICGNGLLALALGGCAPGGADMLPEAVRAVASRAASSTTDRLLVVAATFGDTTMSFATRQALVTAGIIVQEAPTAGDSTLAVLEFVAADETETGWRVRTRRTSTAGAGSSPDPAGDRIEWLVACAAEQCEVTDSTAW